MANAGVPDLFLVSQEHRSLPKFPTSRKIVSELSSTVGLSSTDSLVDVGLSIEWRAPVFNPFLMVQSHQRNLAANLPSVSLLHGIHKETKNEYEKGKNVQSLFFFMASIRDKTKTTCYGQLSMLDQA